MDSGQKIVDENLAKNAAAAGSSRRKSFWSTFRNFSKRKQIGLVLVILLLLGGLVLLSRNVFFADILGVNFTGKIYGQDTKTPLSGVSIFVSSSNENADSVTATTDANGFYSLTLPDSSYNQVVISKDGYWDMAGNIINASGISRIEANLALKPGFGQEQIQLTTIKKERIGGKTHFGLSLQPFDDSPASLKQIVPEGNSYKEKSAYSGLRGYDLEKNDFISSSDTPGQAVSLGNITNDLAHSSATYSPDTDRYYLFKDRKVYEFDRNAPNELSEINQSYDDFSGGASIYLPEYRLILIISGGHAWFFRPQNNQLITLDDMEVPEYDRQKFIRAKGNLFLLGELNAAPGKTGISSIALNEMLFAYTPDTCFQEGKNCRLVVKRDLNVVNKTGLMPYYYPKEDKIYFLGGINGEDGKVSDKILVFDPNNPSQTATELDQSHKLPKPLAGAAYYSTDNNFYLFGGVTDENGSLNKETITFRSRDHYANVESYRPAFAENISNYPFTQDNSSRTIVFTPNVLSITGSLTLKAGQAYLVEQSSSDYTLVFRGKAKRDNFSFATKEIQENNWQNYKPVWFANPFTSPIMLADIQLQYQDKTYNLKEAVDNDLINSNVSISDYPKQVTVDLNNLDISFKTGDYITVGRKKNGIKVNLFSVNLGPYAFGRLDFTSEPSTTSFLSDVEIYIDPISYLILNNGEKLPSEYREILASINSVGHFTIGPLPKGKKIGLIASYNNFQSGIIINVPDNNTEVILSESLSVRPPEPNPNNWNSATLHLAAKDKTGQNIDGEVAILVPLDTDIGSREVNVTNGAIEFSNLPFGTYTVLITKGGQDSIVTYELGTTGTINFQPTTYTPPVITDSFVVEEEI